jgi:hypothetical protein
MALTTGLLAYYRLDDQSGDSADATGNGYNLTNTNTVTYDAGVINNGADFGTANTNKTLRTASNYGLTGTSSITISMWVKLNTEIGSGGFWSLFSSGNSTTHTAFEIFYDYNGGTRRIEMSYSQFGVGSTWATYNVTMGTSNWYHLVLTYDASIHKVAGYVNNVALTAVSASGNGTSGGSNYTSMACFYDASGGFASIKADEVGVWNRVLTSTEVSQLYNSGKSIAYPFRGAVANNLLLFN